MKSEATGIVLCAREKTTEDILEFKGIVFEVLCVLGGK